MRFLFATALVTAGFSVGCGGHATLNHRGSNGSALTDDGSHDPYYAAAAADMTLAKALLPKLDSGYGSAMVFGLLDRNLATLHDRMSLPPAFEPQSLTHGGSWLRPCSIGYGCGFSWTFKPSTDYDYERQTQTGTQSYAWQEVLRTSDVLTLRFETDWAADHLTCKVVIKDLASGPQGEITEVAYDNVVAGANDKKATFNKTFHSENGQIVIDHTSGTSNISRCTQE